MPKKEFVGFKIDTIDLIALDTHAKNAGLNRTAYLREAIYEKQNKNRLDEQSKRDGSDLQKVYQAIAEMNVIIVSIKEQLDTLDNQKMKRIFDRIGRIEERLKQ